MRKGLALLCGGLAAALVAVFISGSPAQSHAAASPTVVYDDSLASGWADWSWNTQVNWQDTSDPHTGKDDVALTFTQGWDGLSVHDNVDVDTTPYDVLRFWINGASSGGQNLSVYVDYSAGGSSSPIDISPYVQGGSVVANTWREVDVPLSALGAQATLINRLDFYNNSGSAQPQMLLDDVSLLNDGKTPPPPKTVNIAVAVNGHANVHPISPYIYGVASAGSAYVKANHLTVERWGGNPTSRYNWRLGAAENTASDWYFENTNYNNSCTAPSCAVDQMVTGDRAAGAASLITVPTLGWVAKNTSLDTCGYAVSKYGPQQQTDPYRPNCGNGVAKNGTPITGNDPTDTSVKSTPADIKAWIEHLVGKFGEASHGGVRFYAMDNEPELWNSTHRDVHPQPLTYGNLYDEFESYASVVRQVDPTAMIDGPIPWGWSAYFDSTYDYANSTESDRQAHGNLPIIPWFLKTVRAHDRASGVRTLNVLDVHYYPQEHNVFSSASDSTTDALRLRATRSLWDPTYTDESWINDKVDLIPRMKAWIAQYYPGTKLGISEWNFGGEQSINGALAIADVLGIYGQEGVYLASYWTHPADGTPATSAFDIYRNYDGRNSSFGNRSIRTVSANPNQLMAFSSIRTRDHKLLVMLINQSPSVREAVSLAISHVAVGGRAAVYQLGSTARGIQKEPSISVSDHMKASVPPYSIQLLVIPK